jgi:hypothetical protein
VEAWPGYPLGRVLTAPGGSPAVSRRRGFVYFASGELPYILSFAWSAGECRHFMKTCPARVCAHA